MSNLIQKIANSFGFTLVKSSYLKKALAASRAMNNEPTFSDHHWVANVFKMAKTVGVNPNLIFDIGANHGNWTREVMPEFPNAHFLMVEPQEWLEKYFSDMTQLKNVSFFPVGAGKHNGSFLFTLVERDDSCSFRHSSEEAIEKGYKQVEIPVKTINQMLVDLGLGIPQIIKIDAEGLDMDVIEGASEVLGKTELIFLEAGVVNKGFDNSVLKTVTLMDEKGYRLFDITSLNRQFKNKNLWLVELAFVLKNGLLDSHTWENYK